MAITATKLGTSLHDDTDAASYTYASAAYQNNKLYICFVTSAIATGTAPIASISGGGLTWVEIGTAGGVVYSGTGNAVRRIQAFRGMVTSGATTGALTITMSDAGSGATSTGCHACVVEVDGMARTGTNGSGAIVQSATNSGLAALNGSVTLNAFGHANYRPLAFFAHRTAELSTVEGSYTSIDDGTGAAPSQGSLTEFLSSATDTTPSASWSTSSDWGGFAIEIKAATWTREQGVGSNSNSFSFTQDVKAGSVIIAVATGDNGVTPATPTDTLGNTYVSLGTLNDTTNGIIMQWWYTISGSAGANAITFTNQSSFDAYVVEEWSTIIGPASLDGSDSGNLRDHTAAADNIVSGSVAASIADALLVGLNIDDGANVVISAGSGFIKGTETNLEGFTGNPVTLESKVVDSSGSYTATFTSDVSGRGMAFVAAFKPTSGAGPVTNEAKYRHNVTPMRWR